MKLIDKLLNQITMYSLMLYFLIMLATAGVVMAFMGYLPYSPLMMIVNIAALYGTCKIVNPIFAGLFKVRENYESSAITGLILSLIVGPVTPWSEIWKLVLIAVIAMLSKYVIVYKRRHLFNPAAFAVTLSAIAFGFGASWWIGNLTMLPFVLFGGLLFLRKSRWAHLSLSFILTYCAVLVATVLYYGGSFTTIPQLLINTLAYSPVLFFSLVMLTEPLTMPGSKRNRVIYGVIIAVLTVLLPIIFKISYGIELSLLLGNIIALIIFGNSKRFMKLVNQTAVAANTVAFAFTPNEKLVFKPGQFLLWSLPHKQVDMRGSRRYFSIASSPTEEQIMLVTKFADQSSSFKKALRELPHGQVITTSSLDGDFILPPKTDQPLVFIAGGVGVVPFRSMVKDMIDKKISRPITLLYSNNRVDEITFKELFSEAEQAFGMKTVYTLTDAANVPPNWTGRTGYIDEKTIKTEVPHYKNALFFISGPDPMVRAMKKTVQSMGVARSRIKSDYFPGYA